MIKPLFQKIIVAVNGSERSVHAAMYGIMMAKQFRCDLKAVYVVDTATIRQLTLTKFFVSEEGADFETNLTEDGNRYLNYVISLAKQKGVKIETELRKGSVFSEIIKAADDYKASAILLGGKEHETAFSGNRDTISATNGDIIANARCNVLVVREPDIEKLFKIA
ncbi:MAG: universal stress protein [Treponema sp.]|nr:universal stress protein [Treponema sp.]